MKVVSVIGACATSLLLRECAVTSLVKPRHNLENKIATPTRHQFSSVCQK